MTRLISTLVLLFVFAIAIGPASAGARGDGDSVVMAQVRGVVQLVEDEFPEIEGSIVKTAALDSNTYALTVPGQISVNEAFARNDKKLQSSVEYDVNIGFHPPLGHCSAAQFLAYHESAHLVDDSHLLLARLLLRQRFGLGIQLHGVLSGYSFHQGELGTINPGEALAEAFAAVHCNGGNWAERALSRML